MSIPSSIADTALGLTTSELQILRQEQQLAAQRSHQPETALRGRGNSRSSQPSSRAASAASSAGGQGRVFLDPSSLQQLNAHFEHLMRRIQNRIDVVSPSTQSPERPFPYADGPALSCKKPQNTPSRRVTIVPVTCWQMPTRRSLG